MQRLFSLSLMPTFHAELDQIDDSIEIDDTELGDILLSGLMCGRISMGVYGSDVMWLPAGVDMLDDCVQSQSQLHGFLIKAQTMTMHIGSRLSIGDRVTATYRDPALGVISGKIVDIFPGIGKLLIHDPSRCWGMRGRMRIVVISYCESIVREINQ